MSQSSADHRDPPAAPPAGLDPRTGLDAASLGRAVEDHLLYLTGRHPRTASLNDVYLAVAYAVRDRLFAQGTRTMDALVSDPDAKRVAYLSAEFLLGPQLGANLLNLGIVLQMRDALRRLGFDLYAVLDHEEEPGLGNGGLGRLAACYMDSMATLAVPAVGYGIRYEFGIFDQEIRDGWQVEVSDKWLRWGNPWEIARPELAVEVGFGGRSEWHPDGAGRFRPRWVPAEVVRSVPHDTPVLGYRNGHCNTLRLWRAEAVESFDVAAFNVGDYVGAVDAKVRSETISKVLYPNDSSIQGKALRLKQQFLFVSSSLQDMLRMLRHWGVRARRPAEALGAAAERHAPGHRRGGTDASARGRIRRRLGHGVGRHRARHRVHEPHAAPRGARDVAGGALRASPAAAPRDRLRDQPPAARRGATPLSRR